MKIAVVGDGTKFAVVGGGTKFAVVGGGKMLTVFDARKTPIKTTIAF